MRAVAVLSCGLALLSSTAPAQTRLSTEATTLPTALPDELVGLWKAKRRFGPDGRGPLVITRTGSTYTGDMMGRLFPVRVERGELSFALPNDDGWFRGRLQLGGRRITGHWISPNSVVHGFKYASPVALQAVGRNRWRGKVAPRDDTFTLYLKVQRRADGSIGAFLRNPERNIGVFYDVDHLTWDGDVVKLIGRRLGQTQEGVLLSGRYDRDNKLLSVAFPSRGGTYDFRREPEEQSDFYPCGKNPVRYNYRPPLARDDGWLTASLPDVNIDRVGIEKAIQVILDMPIASVHAPEVEGVLIARHGRLVLEEYFHGEHRDKLHETRSAAKSLTAAIVGAAIEAGAPLELSTAVYKMMNGGAFPADLEPQKRAMSLEHLLTMSSGYFCDDSNPDAPGNEDTMLNQTDEPDYYRYTLRVPMASAPGEKAVYCSINANLALGLVSQATGESPLATFDRLLGLPMKINHYAWPLDPAGNPYGGGAVQFAPRDFMKLGQLMLNGGTWGGHRILSGSFVSRATSPQYHLRNITYGYLWWGIDYPYKDRTVRAYFAAGNGGQGVIVIPALDLVIAIYGGNYADRVGIHMQQEFVPGYILPAVREPGDDKNAPVKERDYVTPYGPSPISGPMSGSR